jgi:hypothetical protein
MSTVLKKYRLIKSLVRNGACIKKGGKPGNEET